jgi:hypothetical protein
MSSGQAIFNHKQNDTYLSGSNSTIGHTGVKPLQLKQLQPINENNLGWYNMNQGGDGSAFSAKQTNTSAVVPLRSVWANQNLKNGTANQNASVFGAGQIRANATPVKNQLQSTSQFINQKGTAMTSVMETKTTQPQAILNDMSVKWTSMQQPNKNSFVQSEKIVNKETDPVDQPTNTVIPFRSFEDTDVDSSRILPNSMGSLVNESVAQRLVSEPSMMPFSEDVPHLKEHNFVSDQQPLLGRRK